MRDLARRVQALREEMGFVPTEVLESGYIAELGLLTPYLDEMAATNPHLWGNPTPLERWFCSVFFFLWLWVF